MDAIEPYVKHLEQMSSDFSWFSDSPRGQQHIEEALNGDLSKTLRNVVPLKVLQNSGAFFTPDAMATLLVKSYNRKDLTEQTFLDPACGGGNLLLAQARQLPLGTTLEETLRCWGQVLSGSDIHEVLVRATRARLALLAAQRGSFFGERLPPLVELLPHFSVSDSLLDPWPKATHVLLNPPFNLVKVPKGCRWATGRVSQAALFLAKCFEQLDEGATVAALLPDVLRSGSRYRAWRVWLEERADIGDIKIIGRFDPETNVDVFSLVLKVNKLAEKKEKVTWIQSSIQTIENQTVGELCEVKVGRVVPHRDAESGPERLYLDVRHAPAWKHVHSLEYRRYSGVTFSPPFIVVRRNSRSDDRNRAVATLITGHDQIAVENHLIVVRPKVGTVKTCKELMDILRDPRTDQWLNEYIRCRHLTVSSVASIPWWKT